MTSKTNREEENSISLPSEEYSLIDTAEIIITGNEILSGQTQDTNSRFLARELRKLGITVHFISTVSDDPQDLLEAAKLAYSRSDLIITSGGLGPTEDDVTMKVMCQAAGLNLYLDADCLATIEAYFSQTKRKCAPNNRKQAFMPQGGRILKNRFGTAPGAFVRFDYMGKPRHLALLPGPPGELIPMFTDSLKPILKELSPHRYRTHSFRVFGLGESNIEMFLLDLIKENKGINLATYASAYEVEVLVSEIISDRQDNGLLFQDYVETIRRRLNHYIFTEKEETLAQRVLDLLVQREYTIAFAESCTAGLLSSLIGSIPGASKAFFGSVISYSNEIKERFLNVDSGILEHFGAVSQETALAMADGARETFHTDFSISITGIAGPSGGSPEKPVGTVWIGLVSQTIREAFCFQFPGERKRIQERAAFRALDMLRRALENLPLVEREE